MAATPLPAVDRARSAERIERDIETLAGSDYTRSEEAIRRYAYTPEYRATLDYFVRELEAIGFEISYDPVGTLVARNRPAGEPAFGVGSHCDSNRNGGKYDGTMGVVTALEVCRLNAELGLDLPLQLISFLEEEGSGFGQMLLGSRITAQRVTDEELQEQFRAIDDGRSFWEHAEEAGYEPSRWRESIQILDGLTGWIELHIEQARVLQDTGNRLGVVTAIAGYIHARRPPGGPRRPRRRDADGLPARRRAGGSQGDPGGGTARARGRRGDRRDGRRARARAGDHQRRARPCPALTRHARRRRGRVPRGRPWSRVLRAGGGRRARPDRELPPAADAAGDAHGRAPRLARSRQAAGQTGEPFMLMPSGAAHDTMCVADHVPTAMVFVPCRDGISHSPDEEADPADAALGAEVILAAVGSLHASG